jgi:UPF0042 nucleotide-binding protein
VSHEPLQVIVLTGLSGSGKTTALHALEDAGVFCVDNLPTPLVGPFLRLCDENAAVRRVGLAVDVRDRPFQAEGAPVAETFDGPNRDVHVVFLDASDASLINRFKTTRRPHPLMTGRPDAPPTLADAIARERGWLAPLRQRATLVIDTTPLSVHELRARVHDRFATREARPMALSLVSFGFRNGLPPEADFVFDVRFLDNPYFVPELREKTGLDPDVAAFVMAQPVAQGFADTVLATLRAALPAIARERRALLTVAVGCTGGHHRSVALAESLAARLAEDGVAPQIRHRDLHRGP